MRITSKHVYALTMWRGAGLHTAHSIWLLMVLRLTTKHIRTARLNPLQLASLPCSIRHHACDGQVSRVCSPQSNSISDQSNSHSIQSSSHASAPCDQDQQACVLIAVYVV